MVVKKSKCKFCNRKFSKDVTLAAHMCPKKRRMTDENTVGSRIGFRVFQRFFQLTTASKKPKTFEEFVDSNYYIAFVKFGRYIAELNPINTDNFVDFVIKHGIKLKDWQRDYVYETYLNELMKREPPEKGLERTILTLNDWAIEHNTVYNEFFAEVSTIEATYLIKTGKISPWVLYLSKSAEVLLSKLTDEQYDMINGIIDPSIWSKLITKNAEDVKFIKTTLEEAGL